MSNNCAPCVKYLALCVLFIGFILFNVTFWIERWSESDKEVNKLHSVCFDRANDRCCQTFKDRKEPIPGWIKHCANSMNAAYFFVTLTFILLILKFPGEESVVDWIASIFSITTAVCLIISVGLFDQNYKDVSAFKQHRRGSSFYASIACIVIYLNIPFMILLINCFDDKTQNNSNGKVYPSAYSTAYPINHPPPPSTSVNVQHNVVNRNTSSRRRDRRRSVNIVERNCRSQRYVDSCSRSPSPSSSPEIQPGDAPIVKANKTEYKAKAGQNLTLTCTIVNPYSTLKKVVWKMQVDCKTRTLDFKNRRYKRDSPLAPCWIITNLQPSDTGKYQCIATNDYKTGVSEYIHVIVLYPPKVIADGTEYYSTDGRDLDIGTTIDAFPEPTRTYWVKITNTEPQEMHISDGIYYINSSTKSVLQMRKLTPYHTGMYQCIVENDIGIGESEPISVTISQSTVLPESDMHPQQEQNERNEEPTRRYDNTLCSVCMDNPKEVIFRRCNHIACCETCACEIMHNRNRRCPICQAPIVEYLKVFDA